MTEETTAVQTVQRQESSLSIRQISDRVNLVHQVLEKIMLKGTHFGTVPGCGSKMVLLKPGADVLAMTFRLVPQFKVERTDMPDGHREYDVTCSMFGYDGALLGQGVGSASTMEKKYRYRKDDRGQKCENEDIADVYNTVLKIAKKRAQIDATLTVTGAADLFVQDMVQTDEDEPAKEPVKMPVAKAPVVEAKPAVAPEPKTITVDEGEVAGDNKVVVGQLLNVAVKESRADAAKKWKKWGLKINEDWYSTFDHKIGEAAQTMQSKMVRVEYEVDAKGFNAIKEFGLADEGEAATPVESTPF